MAAVPGRADCGPRLLQPRAPVQRLVQDDLRAVPDTGPPMARCPQLRLSPAGLLQSLLLLVTGATSAQEENSTEPTSNYSTSPPPPLLYQLAKKRTTMEITAFCGPNVAAIVAPTVILGLLAIAGVAAVVLLRVKKKRQTEGTYRPSSEEQTGTRSEQAPDALKLPKEERLI
ncbi:hypothetical protein AAFF_G00270290 [Aldrovandia affinis]|uniref:Protein crumbs homolog 3 n=1 Tax=Aldrovandia affinis TaxID=143900 RepID=A0AAD7RDT8_9TELE|nr:hypothetical protein AAFF_G00270290 [Aldrovandia affinis]